MYLVRNAAHKFRQYVVFRGTSMAGDLHGQLGVTPPAWMRKAPSPSGNEGARSALVRESRGLSALSLCMAPLRTLSALRTDRELA